MNRLYTFEERKQIEMALKQIPPMPRKKLANMLNRDVTGLRKEIKKHLDESGVYSAEKAQKSEIDRKQTENVASSSITPELQQELERTFGKDPLFFAPATAKKYNISQTYVLEKEIIRGMLPDGTYSMKRARDNKLASILSCVLALLKARPLTLEPSLAPIAPSINDKIKELELSITNLQQQVEILFDAIQGMSHDTNH